MRLSQQIYLVFKNLRQSPGRAFLACFGVGVGMAIFLAAVSLGWGVQFGVLKRLRESMPEQMMSARPSHLDVGPLRFQPGMIGAARIERIRALPDVESTWPQIPINFPIRAEGELLGVQLSSDVVVNGVEPALVNDAVAPGKRFDWAAGDTGPAPVIVSRYLLDLYNLGYAEANRLPKLSDKAVIGRHFDLVLGQSTIPALGDFPNARRVRCEVVGLTANPSLLGFVMPSALVAAFNREFLPDVEPQYNAVHIRLRSVDGLERVERALAEMGLQPDSQRELLRRVQFFLRMLLGVVLLFGGLVLVVALCNVVNTFSLILLERRFEIGLLRAIGSTRALAVRLFLLEAGALGAAGGIFGGAAAFALAFGVNRLCRSYLPPLSILPAGQPILVFGWPLALLGILLAAGASMAATFPIVLSETARQPARLLRQN